MTRRPLIVGGGATAVDVGLFLLLAGGLAVSPPLADLVALVAATPVSFFLHRLPGGGRPYQRWVEHPAHFGTVVAIAGAIDITIVALFTDRSDGVLSLLLIKSAALGVAAVARLAGYRRLLLRAVRDEQGVPDVHRGPAPGTRRFTVVLPAFEEAGQIGDSVAAVRAAFEDDDLEVIVVDDGSHDATAAEADAAGADQVLVLESNEGKGAAVRAGVLVANGRVVAFTDADLAYSPDHLVTLRDTVERGWDVVVGSRRHTEATALVRAGRVRELGGRGINLLTQMVLLGRYVDTQCGLKAFRGDVGRSIFSRTQVDGFAFDVEVFHIVERDRLSLKEVPVRVVNSERSSVRILRDAFRLVVDLFRIRRRAAVGAYAPERAEADHPT